MKKPLLALVAALLPLTTACANHVRYVDMKDNGRVQRVAASRIVVEPELDVLDSERIALRFTREDRVESRPRTRLTKLDEYTPYSPVRELYEVPLGAASLPLSISLNVVDSLLLGWVPDSVMNAYTFWTFAALNPFMNTESASRVEHREVRAVHKDGAVREELVAVPLRDHAVEVRLDRAPPVHMRTDVDGGLRIDLLELVAVDCDAHRLTVTLPASKPLAHPTKHSFYVGRALAGRLQRAHGPMRVIANDSSPASALAAAIRDLERLGFGAQSLRIEDEIRERLARRPAELAKFAAALGEAQRAVN